MATLPTGVVTFVFTDIEASTPLLEDLPHATMTDSRMAVGPVLSHWIKRPGSAHTSFDERGRESETYVSFFVGAGLWMGVGVVLMFWANDAERKWQGLLTTRGLMPDGPDSPTSAALHPVSFFRRRWAYLTVAFPRALRTSDSEVETWRLRRSRRRRLFVAWRFGGLIFAILTMVTIDGARENSWWLAALVPIAASLSYVIRVGYVYGSGGVDEVAPSERMG